ncbi:MAG: hypothetical protein ACXWUG_05960 [Polyangiales bacterium]
MTSDRALRAARLASFPGVTIAEACARFGVGRSAVARARKELGRGALQPSVSDLVIAALTANGTRKAGALPTDYAAVASFVDYVNHDGCTADEVRGVVETLSRDGTLRIHDGQFELLVTWPVV